MRDISLAYAEANESLSREPRFLLKIENDNGALWFSSHDDVTPTLGVNDQYFPGVIVSSGGATQRIQPEKGFSTIGSVNVEMLDEGITDALRALLNDNNDTIVNNKAIMYTGFDNLAVADYLQIFPYYVEKVNNDDLTFKLKLSDAQRFTKKSLFRNRPTTELAASIGLSLVNEIVVQSLTDFELVEHGPSWTNAPNTTVGYLKLTGSSANGQPVTEYASYTGTATSPNRFTGVIRGLFGTDLVDGIGDQPPGEGNTEVQEMVYLDLPIPKMILALLTGDLYGQPGAVLPDRWHAGITVDQLDLASFENVGEDLWNTTTDEGLSFEFIDLEGEDAKNFIYQELMRVCNLFLLINQNGELSLKRFTAAPTQAPGAVVLNYDNVRSMSGIDRDAKAIRNVFAINWEYRRDIERFMRSDNYVDSNSQQQNNITSAIYTLNLRGARNSGREVRQELNSLAEGIRARYSQPAVMPKVSAWLRDTIEIEVGDIVTLDFENHKDYASADGLLASFEVQGITYDFVSGTASFDLFGSSGQPSGIEFGPNDAVTTINHGAGWTDIRTVVTGVEASNVFTITANSDLPAGKYYYDGTLRIANGVTVTVNETVTVDAFDIDMVGTAKFDGAGRGGAAGQRHYFGGADAAQEGVETNTKSVLFFGYDRRYRREGFTGTRVAASNTKTGDFQGIKIDEANNIIGLPSDLAGNGGARGETSHIFDDGDGSNDNIPGGAAVNGGAGLCLICDNLFVDPGSRIDLSGSDNNVGSFATIGFSLDLQRYHAGASGFGWPGALLILIKNPASPIPIVDTNFIANTGAWIENPDNAATSTRRPPRSGYEYKTPTADYRPLLPDARKFANTNYAPYALRVKRVYQPQLAAPTPGITASGPAALPEIALAEQINTPPTPTGGLSTVTITSTPPGDSLYSYSLFEYRLKGQLQWVPIEYGVRNEATVTLATDGSDYEFSARSVSVSGQISTGRKVAEIKLSVVSEEPEETNTVDDAIQVAQIRRLELTNAIDDDNVTQWKGPDAEFRWAKLRFGETNIEADPKQDQHLDGYRVQVFRTSDGKLLRELTVQDTFYTYTLLDNRRDNVDINGNPTPVRGIRVKVAAVASTGVTSKAAEIVVSNPAPAPVTGVQVIYAREGIELSYTPPSDVDFRGVKIRGRLYTGTSVTLAPMTARSETLNIVSVDQFGDGETLNYALTNAAPSAPALAVEGIGFTSARVNIGYPSDYDLIGADVRFRVVTGPGPWSLPIRITANEVNIEGLLQNTEYEVEVTPVDTLGAGTAASVTFTTEELTVIDVSGLSNWATETNPVDLAFIQANMSDEAIPSQKIESLTVARLTAGQVTVQIDLGTGILLDGGNGYIQTINDSYSTFLGPVSRPSLSANPVVLHDWDDGLLSGTFWFDLAGNYSLGKGGIVYDVISNLTTFGALTLDGDTGTIGSATFEIDGAGNATFSGDVTGATITGSTFQTAATGKQVFISASLNAFFAYVDGTTNKPYASVQAQANDDGVFFGASGVEHSDLGTNFNDGISTYKGQADAADTNRSPIVGFTSLVFSGGGDKYGYRSEIGNSIGDGVAGQFTHYGVSAKTSSHSSFGAKTIGVYGFGEYGVYGEAYFPSVYTSWAGYFNGDVEIINGDLILTSPDSNRWRIGVDNSGNITTTVI